MLEHHDVEWGAPSHDDRYLFEMLTLEGAQAGLSWSTILNKREGYRRAFAGFDPVAVARFTRKDVERLLEDTGIVRNRLKVESTVANAARVLEMQEEHGSFDAYLWAFVERRADRRLVALARRAPVRNRPLARAFERPEAARLPVRRADCLLRVHANRRDG